jgi:prepilin-type N-terminal cleavage/methylation domain-containing protein
VNTQEAKAHGLAAWPISGWPLARAVRSRLVPDGGWTLVELLVVILVAAILSGGIYGLLSSVSGVFADQGVRVQNQNDARTALNEMTRYLRMATSSADNQTSQSNSIASASSQAVEFYCDLDGDGIAEKARYYLQGTTLKMQTVDPTWVLTPAPHWTYPAYTIDGVVIQNAVRNGANPVFRYYRYVGGVLVEFTPNTAALRQQIVTISISLTVNEVPELARGNVVLSTDVQLRQRYEGGLE